MLNIAYERVVSVKLAITNEMRAVYASPHLQVNLELAIGIHEDQSGNIRTRGFSSAHSGHSQ